MANVNYQCAVNNAHTKVIPDYAKAVPSCCGKPMNKIQAAPATASPKPAAASMQTPMPQGPAQQQHPKK